MLIRIRQTQADYLATETVKVGLPLNVKRALAETARISGTSMSALLRAAAEDAIARGSRPRGRRA